MTHDSLTPEQLEAIRAYAKQHGRKWKDQLNNDWMYARTIGTLQQLRNTHGPSWLVDFKLPKEGSK
ncbi:hypothetical protein GOC13_07485 [Sinorhizobium meliloti]|nr:hypothetical protein [Sinorhizobium meliloti]